MAYNFKLKEYNINRQLVANTRNKLVACVVAPARNEEKCI